MFPPQAPNGSSEHFLDLATRRIPALLAGLEASCDTPWGFSDFEGKAKATCQNQLAPDGQDYPGCYLLFDPPDKEHPFRYVGISRNVVGRIWTHYRGSTHHQTSLVYKIARMEDGSQIQQYRGERRHEIYRREFAAAQKKLRSWSVAHVQVDDPLSLYLLEVTAAMHFKTGVLNCFKTH